MNWLEIATTRLMEMLQSGLAITGTKEGAINHAKLHSCAGQSAWKQALANLGWED